MHGGSHEAEGGRTDDSTDRADAGIGEHLQRQNKQNTQHPTIISTY